MVNNEQGKSDSQLELREIERHEGNDERGPAYEVVDTNDEIWMSDQTYYPTAPTREVARRFVACWNACEGISTDWLEGRAAATTADTVPLDQQLETAIAQRDELLAALQKVVAFWDSISMEDCVNDIHVEARAAISRATWSPA